LHLELELELELGRKILFFRGSTEIHNNPWPNLKADDMKRSLDHFEISDDEWEEHSSSFKPSRVLKKSRTPTPPAIESFAYRASQKRQVSVSLSDDDDCVEIKNHLEDDDCVEIKNELEDEDEEEVRPVTRGRRFVVEDEDSDGDWADLESTSEEEEVEEVEDDDVVGKALQLSLSLSLILSHHHLN
jgi:SWI/SNF-related matrix-associated actin-dependent regulator 1 of chromatin subfamily A